MATQFATGAIPVDPKFEGDDDSSGYGSNSSGSEYSTESLTSSIYEYRYENGRRYHAYKEGKYMFPNDEAEQERLDILHHTYLLMLDGELHRAPVGSNPQKILDIGTGTGIWAIDCGERYPSAQVIGTDLSPIQPSWVPPNVQFQIDDAEGEWTFPRDSFDLIHIRHLTGAIHNWEKLLEEAYKACKPGGYIDVSEYEMSIFSDDNTLTKSMALWKYYDLVDRAALKTGRGFRIAKELKPLIQRAGFINLDYQTYKLPMGPWAADKKQKQLGAYVLLSAETGFEAFGIKLFTNVWGMSAEEASNFIGETMRDAKNKKVHSYAKQHLYYAQKPLKTSPYT